MLMYKCKRFVSFGHVDDYDNDRIEYHFSCMCDIREYVNHNRAQRPESLRMLIIAYCVVSVPADH